MREFVRDMPIIETSGMLLGASSQISSKIANAKGVLSAKRILEGTISCVMAIEKNKLLVCRQ